MNPQDINKQIETINKGVSDLNKERGTNLSGLGTIPETVTSKELNAPALDIPTQPPSTAIKGEISNLESQADSFTKNLQTKAEQSQKQEEISFNELIKQAVDAPTQSQLESQTFAQKGGVNDVEKELNDINSQMRAEQQSLRRKIETVQTEAGLTKGQVNQEVSEIERVSLRKQADLAVIQQSVQGRYDSAKTIADRAIQAEMDFEKKKLDLLQLSYDRNKSLFDKSEQRLFETQQADRNRKLEQEEKRMQEISDLSLRALEEGAPTSIANAMRGAKTLEEAIGIGGRYIGSTDRQAKGLSARKALIDLAKAGDRNAIAQLGYDPSIAPQDIATRETVYGKAKEDVTRLNRLLENTTGRGVSSGILTGNLIPALASGLFTGLGGATVGSVIPGIGTIAGGVTTGLAGAGASFATTKKAQQTYLNDIDFIVKNLTFDRIKELSDQGVKLTPLSNADMQAIAQSSSVLATAIRRENNDPTGKITKIDLPEDEVQRIVSDMLAKAKRVENELNMKDAFNTDELVELSNL